MVVLKVDIDSIMISIAATAIGHAVMLVIMYAEIFKRDIIVFIRIKRNKVMSH